MCACQTFAGHNPMASLGYILLHFVPAFPLLTRGGLVVMYRKGSRRILPEAATERDQARGVALSLAGFSFAAVVALILTSRQTEGLPLGLPMYLAFVSFVAFMGAVGLEGHKSTVRADIMAGGLREAGLLSLLLGLIVLLLSAADFPATYRYGLPVLGLGVWLWDHVLALQRNYTDLDLRGPQ